MQSISRVEKKALDFTKVDESVNDESVSSLCVNRLKIFFETMDLTSINK
jgi:hypothetical protein